MQLTTNDVSGTIEYIKKTYAGFSSGYPFDFFFLKDEFQKYNRSGEAIGKLLIVFTAMAIFISLIGILGLVAYSTEQKSKEIGIRKILGASSGNIVLMLCKEFIKWVLISNLVIWPVAYFALSKFLNSFAYRINFNYLVLIITLGITLTLTIIAVSYHSIKAAVSNPVDSLKYE
jgi:putative ABC transport system permease protein